MTLLELTVVVVVILSLVTVMFLAASSWKNATDRSRCILNISTIQKVGRSYQNLHVLSTSDPFDQSMLIGPDTFLQSKPECPSGGPDNYKFVTEIPDRGELFMKCDIATHRPNDTSAW